MAKEKKCQPYDSRQNNYNYYYYYYNVKQKIIMGHPDKLTGGLNSHFLFFFSSAVHKL